LVGLFVVTPVVVYLLSIRFYSIAKFFRVQLFGLLDAKAIATGSIVIIALFSGLFLFNLFWNRALHVEETLLNVLFLDFVVLLVLVLIATGQFKIIKPSALLLRVAGRPEVYLYEDDIIRHIPNPQTLHLFGFSFKDVQEISERELRSYNERAPIQSVSTARLIQAHGRPEVYLVNGDFKHHVPDPPTRDYILFLNQRQIETVPQQEVDRLVEKQELKSILA
jgi:hypothetical protein